MGMEGKQDIPLARHVHKVLLWDTGSFQAQQLWPLSVTRSEYRHVYRWELHHPPYLALELLLDGELFAEIDGKQYHLVPGDLLMFHKPEKAVLYSGKRGYFRKTALLLQGTLLDTIMAGFSLDSSRVVSLNEPGIVEEYFQSIGSLLEKKKPESIHKINGKNFELLSFLSETAASDNAFPEELKRACRFLEMNIENTVSLAELAGIARCSVSTLQRYFRRYLQKTVYEYRRQQRLELAENLLKNTVFSIKEIAARTGYTDQAHFSNDFKKFFHLSPLAWRRKK